MADTKFTASMTEAQRACIADSVEDVDAWVEHAMQWAIDHKAVQCRNRLLTRDEGLLLTEDTVPRDLDARAAAIIAAPGYKDRVARDAEGSR